MANDYTNRFGRGMMPVFNINPGATTPLDVGADAAATEAAYLNAMAEREATNKSNIAAFSDGIESLKGLMSKEDQEEEALQDLITNAVVPGADEEEGPGLISNIDSYIQNQLTDLGNEKYQAFKDTAGGMYNSFMEDPNPFSVDELSVPIDSDGDGEIDEYEKAQAELENELKMMDARNSIYYNYVDPVKDAVGDFMTSPEMEYTKDLFKLPLLYAKDKFIDPYFKSDDDPTTFKADGGRIGFEEGGGLFERTSQIPEMFTTDELPSDPLSQIVKIGMAVRAPLLDVVEMLGLGAKESARIVSDLVKQGYDVTEPIRDVAGDAIADTAEFIQEDARDMGRFMSPAYYADRFIVPALRGEEARTDTETRLRKELSDRGRSSATQERTEMLKQKLFEETFGKDTQGRSALARPVEIDLGDDIRVNYNTGGVADPLTAGLTYGYSPFMDAQQGFDYYTQFGSPNYGPPKITLPVEPVDPMQEVKPDPIDPGFTEMGTLAGTGSKGPEDRMEGFRPQDNPLSFSNPKNQTTMKFVDGKLVYDNVNPYLKTGVVSGDEVPIASPIMSGLSLLGSLFGFDKKQKEIDDEIAEHNFKTAQEVQQRQKKEKEEREAAAAQKAAEEAAAEEEAQTLKETYAANQYSGGDKNNKSGNAGTGTFSGGQVSGFTGQGQSPHSSMSTAGKNKNNKKNNFGGGVGGGAGPKGGTGKPGDGNRGPQGRSRCFVKGTMVEMADGTTKEITTITPGMETRGGTVEFVLQGLPVDIWDYKGVKVSGTHWVVEDNQLIAVEDSKHGIKTDMFEPVYSMKTSKQRMWVKGIEFGDFESGTDEDWEPYFEKVRQDLNKKLHEKRKENQQSDERV